MLRKITQCTILEDLTAESNPPIGNWLAAHQWRLNALIQIVRQNAACKCSHIFYPASWRISSDDRNLTPYDCTLLLKTLKNEISDHKNILLNHAKNVTRIDPAILRSLIERYSDIDVLAVNVRKDLTRITERAILNEHGNVCGFKRFYNHGALREMQCTDWPDYLLINSNILTDLPDDIDLITDFTRFWKFIIEHNHSRVTVGVPGQIVPLQNSVETVLDMAHSIISSKTRTDHTPIDGMKKVQDPSIRIIGNVLAGPNLSLGKNCVLLGPSIIGKNVHIQDGSLIDSSVIDDNTCVESGSRIRNTFLTHSETKCSAENTSDLQLSEPIQISGALGYPNYPKRCLDALASLGLILVSAPVMLAIAAAIKLESPGPAIFKHRRQGLSGREFQCLKFRTMVTGADQMQQILRSLNEVDGPQFKIENDPRVSRLGRFLRATYLDELPQLFNVLAGHMSLVGPRPSPARENLFCPHWHDARLSVKPGITGLWQVKRNPERTHDFQEWLKYDVEYVNSISFKLDLWIFLQTIKKLTSKLAEPLAVRIFNWKRLNHVPEKT
ncbi:UDP-glucose:undecaprenyl-phosphate glucose-1-phosphate transferase [Anaerohalosphaera lusitana]|uniref:UDP-glucose:undecaprenyl-phosphate glucose-1-phosphate transferase n=1 Tax=Anaerohalosphaera lusitana TaxID=1936003 RepID=A0A1U9NNI2_9BACT|nr:sugar transferase [Anaerohalosphaera lusitana]AQT69463.1 UDP-glucose:undecaprenyl-phosphate glucose-1-phosphate transferase [Anaerohalosphaera lusitana]